MHSRKPQCARWTYLKRGILFVVGVLPLALTGCGKHYSDVDSQQVLDIALQYESDDGVKSYLGSGVLKDIKFHDQRIVGRDPSGFNCVGFTFQIADQLIQESDLKDRFKDPGAYIVFQQKWYQQSTDMRIRYKGAIAAMVDAGVGWEVPLSEASPGDFMVIHRKDGTGHQAIFVDWLYDDKKRVGVRFFGAHDTGIDEKSETFSGTGVGKGSLTEDKIYFGRLNI